MSFDKKSKLCGDFISRGRSKNICSYKKSHYYVVSTNRFSLFLGF